MIVYLATNTVNGMQYVGVTTRKKLSHRIGEHFKYAQRKNRNPDSFAAAIAQHGMDNIRFEVIAKPATLPELSEAEKFWIKKLNTLAPNGYNLNPGGVPLIPSHASRNRTFVVEGKEYFSLMSLAAEYDVDHHNLRHRLFRSVLPWSLEQALGLEDPPEQEPVKFFKNLEVRGTVYKSQAEACRKYGVAVRKFRQRIRKGWSVDEALEIVERVSPFSPASKEPHPNPLARKIVVGDKEYKTLKHAAEDHGLTASILAQRLKRGWSVFEALGLATRKTKKRHGKPFAGYPSMKEAARAHGLKITTVHARVKRGASEEEALTMPLTPNDGSRRYG